MKVYPAKDGVEMDFCYDGCKGLWFDRYELAFYADTEEDVPNFENLVQLATQTPYQCSKCSESLMEIRYVEEANLKIDFCKKCHGVFLDAHELGLLKAIAAKKSHGFERIKRLAQRLEDQGFSVHKRA